MENNEITRVVFRKFKDGEVIAVLPDLAYTYGNLTSYTHIGQHSCCAPWIADFTKPATPKEYEGLKKELESIGYKLKVYKRITKSKKMSPNYGICLRSFENWLREY